MPDSVTPPAQKNIHLYRQILATLAACFLSMAGGITFGYTSVLLPQLKEDPNFPYDQNLDSWIASIAPFAMMFGSIVSGPTSDLIGRRRGQILISIPYSIGWAVMGLATNNTVMLLGRFITGFCTGANRPLNMVYVGEVSDPKHRAVTLVCPSIAIFVGSLISHTAGQYIPWRIGCFFFIFPNVLCCALLWFLKESPIWLITKGKTEEGIASFKEFRGETEAAEKELKSVLESHEGKEMVSSLKDVTNVVFSKPFMKSMLIIFLLFFAMQFNGVNTITFYSQDIFRSTFKGEVDAFMMMIVTDVIRVLTSGSMCLIAKRIPQRTSFFVSCFSTVVVLILLVIYLYINPEGLLWIPIITIIAYLGVAGAMTCTSWSFVSEIFPSNVRGLGSGISTLISFALLFVSVKVTPGILTNFGDAVMYGSFAVVTLVCGVFLKFLLPETGGRSLQDIENTMYNKKTKPSQLESVETTNCVQSQQRQETPS